MIEATVIYWAQLILGLYGAFWITWPVRWWLGVIVFFIPFAGIIIGLFYLLFDINIPEKIMGTQE